MKVKSNSLFINIFFQYIIIILALTLTLSIFYYKMIKKDYINNLKEELKNNLLIINELIINDYKSENFELLNKKVGNLGKKINKRITIIKLDGKVIADSEEDYSIMENHVDRPEIIDAYNGNIGESIRFSNTLKLNMLYITMPLIDNGEIAGVLRISFWLKDIKGIIKIYQYKIITVSLILIILTLIFSFYLSKKFTNPIRELSEASKDVAKGNFNVSVFLNNSTEEINTLVNNFNIMTNKLKTYFEALKYEKEELESIITSTRDGIIVVDNSGKIVRSNQSFSKIVNTKNINNKYYWEVLRNSDITDFIKNDPKKSNVLKKSIVKEIFFNNKTLLCSMNQLLSNNGYVFIFYDITDLKNLENIKKDFVSNVSHELRTPLTAIKGFTETLLEEEKNKNKLNYLEIINKHTERLINIVSDLLLLSKLEQEKIDEITIEKFDLMQLVSNTISIFEEKVKNKNIDIIIENNNKSLFIESDPFKIEQIIINLVDNAIKYTDNGNVIIKLVDSDESVTIEISDSGIGIPEKDQARIFERFYVVDKSRSKKNGGTGLGLSIVKHDVMLLNGEISIKSQLGKGTIFNIILPKKITS